jgi:hypothetical protein
MTRLAPETPFSEQHAELTANALPFPRSSTLPILKRCFHAFETALKVQWQHRILPDEVNAEVLGCSGEETRQ